MVAEVASWSGHLVGALQFTRDLCKSLAESTNHVDKTRTFALLGDLEMVWKILRLCSSWNCTTCLKSPKRPLCHYVSLRPTKSRITSSHSKALILWDLFVNCSLFLNAHKFCTTQKAPAAASPVNRVGWLNKHSRSKMPAAICLSTIVAHPHIALCSSSWSLHGNLPCGRKLSITSFKEFPPESSDLVRMVATSFSWYNELKYNEPAELKSRSTQKINWACFFAADLCSKSNNLDKESYFTYEPGKTLK